MAAMPLDITYVMGITLLERVARSNINVPWDDAAGIQAVMTLMHYVVIQTRHNAAHLTTFAELETYQGNAHIEFADACCPITLGSLADLDDPVVCNVRGTYQLCSFNEFRQYWIRSGKNIFTNLAAYDWNAIEFLKVARPNH
jgi:hypothetical protein